MQQMRCAVLPGLRAIILMATTVMSGALMASPSQAAEKEAAASNASMFVNEADGANWATYGRTFSETHYSPLTQINERNISRLKLAWYIDLPTMISAVGEPLAVNGVIYFAVGHANVYAADAATGEVLWTYDPKVTEATNDKLRPAWGTRGLAYADNRIFVGTMDGRLIALSADKGELLWSVLTVGPDDARYITGAPRVFNGKVLIGHGAPISDLSAAMSPHMT